MLKAMAEKMGLKISIHPPRVGWDEHPAIGGQTISISIHPPRVGWDFCHGITSKDP